MNFNEIQRIVLLVGLAFCAYVLIVTWNADYGESKPTPNVPADPTSAIEEPIGADTERGGTDDIPSIPQAPPRTDSTATAAPDTSRASPMGTDLVTVTTPLMTVQIDKYGGDMVTLDLQKYAVTVDQPESPLRLLDNGMYRSYTAMSGLMGPDGIDTTSARPRYRATRSTWQVNDGSLDVVLRHTTDEDVEIAKTFTFSADSYLVKVRYTIDNRSASDFRTNLFATLRRDGSEVEETKTGFTFAVRSFLGGALTTNETRYEKLHLDDIDEAPFGEWVNGGWIAFLQHYFVTAWIADTNESNHYYGRRGTDGLYRFGLVGQEISIPPNSSSDVSLRFYGGPKIMRDLKEVAPNLELTVDYGFLWFLSMPLFYVLDFIQSWVVNWGLAIIFLTVFIKLVMFPLSQWSMKSMARMKLIAPQQKRIQERYANDKEKMTKATLDLWSKEGVNPAKGCMPLILQMPVFIALYWLLWESIELRHAPFILWIDDLSAIDEWFILPILMGASMYAAQLLNPSMPDPMQQKMFMMMPVIFTIFMAWFPSGLVLYWLINNVLTFAQQYWVTHQMELQTAKPKSRKG